MSDEPLVRQLSRFTPDGRGLDRDSLLFAAGQASVRSRWHWMALAGALGISQAITLGLLLWPGPAPTVGSLPLAAPNVAPEPEREVGPLRKEGVWTLRDVGLAAAENQAPVTAQDLMPADPPLHAFGAIPPAWLN